ncbi:hypothetical protein FRB90_011411 [Tulasnella sp. 427]|nr:hypothetical protein FRB90_011411 [Tulasnella sp. 427]
MKKSDSKATCKGDTSHPEDITTDSCAVTIVEDEKSVTEDMEGPDDFEGEKHPREDVAADENASEIHGGPGTQQPYSV